MALCRWLATSLALAASFAAAQFPPTPEGITTKQVTSYPGVSISYKETFICEENARAWSGYVHMPTSYLQDIEGSDPYNVSMFFWYFEARNNPENAPTAIYLAGGPGESSMFGATSDGGPCYINEDSNSTYNNPWSWNTHVNMLYIDQPVSTGYSYDTLVKSVQDLLPQSAGIIAFEDLGRHVPAENTTFKYGVFPSQNLNHTANTTAIAAITLWHFSQVWFSEFPEWKTSDTRVSIWGNSYGGFWVPATAAYFQKQNVRISSGEISGTIISLDAIGITNGCIDMLYQTEWYPHMYYKNTYDLQIISKEIYKDALHNYTKPGGCKDQMLQCRALGALYDPDELGVNATVNEVCETSLAYCGAYVALGPYQYSLVGPRSAFDMAHRLPDPFPPLYPAGFFNQGWVQKALGSPVNFTANSVVSQTAILGFTGDLFRREGLKDVEYLLDSGVKVTLIYGDRDQRCPWLGAEKLSLAADWDGVDEFRAAGYAYIHTNASYDGGVVRQHGNLSFSRVFEAGHDVAAYQPETVFQIFDRALSNKDVATGKKSTAGSHNDYSTKGPSSSNKIKNKLPPSPPPNCYLYDIGSTCTNNQLAAIMKGTAEIVDFRVVKPAGGGGPILAGGLSF